MILEGVESAMNFNKGTLVKYHRHNHGFEYEGAWYKVRDVVGVVTKVETREIGDKVGDFELHPIGTVMVKFEGRDRSIRVKCRNLSVVWG